MLDRREEWKVKMGERDRFGKAALEVLRRLQLPPGECKWKHSSRKTGEGQETRRERKSRRLQLFIWLEAEKSNNAARRKRTLKAREQSPLTHTDRDLCWYCCAVVLLLSSWERVFLHFSISVWFIYPTFTSRAIKQQTNQANRQRTISDFNHCNLNDI